jgi:hypothetical protein
MEITFNISDEAISDQLCTALEGGSNYWYYLGDIDRTHFIKGETLVDNLTRSFLADKNYKLPVYDIESGDEFEDMDKLGDVTYDSMAKAFSIMSKDYPRQLGNILAGNYDGDDSDVWFQIAVMGEVIYG